MSNRPIPSALPAPSLLPVETYENKGSGLHILEDNSLPVVQVEFAFENGSMHQKEPLLNSFGFHLLFSGTSKYSQQELLDKFDDLGVHYQTELDHYTSGFTITCLKRNLKASLSLISELLEDFVVPEKEFESYRERRIQEFQINLEKPAIQARRRLNNVLYGDKHPGGRLIDLSDFQRITSSSVVNNLREVIFQTGIQIYLAGAVSANDKLVLRSIVDRFPVNKTGSLVAISHAGQDFSQEIEHAVQSSLRLGQLIEKPEVKVYYQLKLLYTVFAGYFGSRLMQNLREEKGLTYGVSGGISMNKQIVQATLSTDVDVSNKELAFQSIKDEMLKLQNDVVQENELIKVKNYMKGQLLQASDGVFAQIDLVKLKRSLNLNDGYYKKYVEVVDATDAQSLRELAGKYLNYNDLLKVSIG